MKFKLNENVLRVTLLFFCVIFGFITSLSFIIFLELSISIISFKNMSEPKHRHIKSVMDQQMKNATQQLEEFEQHYGCCGIYGTESKCSTYSVAVVIDIENPNSPTYTTLIPDYVEGCYSVAIRVITTISRRTCTYSTVFIILQALGIAIIIIGILALYDLNVVTFLFDSVVYSSTITLIGTLLCLVAICGIIAVLVPSRVFMYLYAIFILLFAVTSIVLCIAAFVQKGLYWEYTVYERRALKAYFEEYKQTGYLVKCRTTGMCEHIVDVIQFRWKCCGLDDLNFWTDDNSTLIPASCCMPENAHPCLKKDIFKEACGPKGFTKFHQDLFLFEVSFLLLFLLYLIIFIIMVYLVRTQQEEYYLQIPRNNIMVW
ncbi:unnamed protein product [Brassicogethes aeneus]|uniref:Tetraspanin n=1 Tax=Brassicogethes aeneus TaxID=1431903 RepID=A0A9P0B3Q1_BRAAE|nr:unnamed protein product [Brassicogethes aeneus]